MSLTRLNKHVAHIAGISRRAADDLILSGAIRVDGQPVTLGAQLDPTDHVITFRGKELAATSDYTYLLLNKPIGYVSSRRQQGDTPTIYGLLPDKYRRLKPVGRLDKDSSGLLLLSDDGDFTQQMTHPSFKKQKTYEITLNKPLEPLHQQMISDHGIMLDDGPSKLMLESMSDDKLNWRVLMHEGRNRQIRRTFAALDYVVKTLHRTHFGSFQLHDLGQGEYKEIKI